ncbi:DNA endonuclease SmrA [Vibrio ulleungensis]|uniref:DNA endonuclease SmrA n=1 Tax=Vibrio ulleungensis TaxID=2807619 RepID=A0ABS2HFR0_9VIBR|nr:DNA endonuclease SmrA [Vibrio ulleungensis]MBM7036378.1 DNA endonuclease SmrA [Vibrio ulleungensis]
MSNDALDGEDLFRQMMGDVTPLKQDTTNHENKSRITDAQLARQAAAVKESEPLSDYLTLDNAPIIKPDDLIEYKKDGVQDGVYKKLRLGKYPIQARLDLHKKSLKHARDEVIEFVKRCMRLDIRTVVIVHGKGHHSNPPALIKSYLAAWLEHIPEVMCAHSALPQHGGTGALYLMLRKSDAKKQETRERHQKRLG